MPENINREEWYAELLKLQQKNGDEGFTALELQDTMKINIKRIREFLKQGVLSGKIAVGKRYVQCDWDGHARWYQVYKLK